MRFRFRQGREVFVVGGDRKKKSAFQMLGIWCWTELVGCTPRELVPLCLLTIRRTSMLISELPFAIFDIIRFNSRRWWSAGGSNIDEDEPGRKYWIIDCDAEDHYRLWIFSFSIFPRQGKPVLSNLCILGSDLWRSHNWAHRRSPYWTFPHLLTQRIMIDGLKRYR